MDQSPETGNRLASQLPGHSRKIQHLQGGTGLKGMEAANANQYFAGASGFPDFMIFGLDMLQTNSAGVRLSGFFDNDWKLKDTEWEENK